MSGMKVLLVDNEPNVLEVMRLGLGIKGYDVDTVRRAVRALEALKKKQYDVILLDLLMPEMSGIELLKQIKQLDIKSKIFILSGYVSDEVIQEAMDEGAAGYITKPSSADQICSSIEKAFSEKQ